MRQADTETKPYMTRGILSPLRLPVPPWRRVFHYSRPTADCQIPICGGRPRFLRRKTTCPAPAAVKSGAEHFRSGRAARLYVPPKGGAENSELLLVVLLVLLILLLVAILLLVVLLVLLLVLLILLAHDESPLF